ncbi:MAG: hypothetical protein U5L04_09480 [Trueperaceae bacterium]|nr:hypothetical protein [Trueperaceae bacterium]
MTTDRETTDDESNDKRTKKQPHATEEELLRHIYELVGPAPEDELMSEALIRERRAEAAREENE